MDPDISSKVNSNTVIANFESLPRDEKKLVIGHIMNASNPNRFYNKKLKIKAYNERKALRKNQIKNKSLPINIVNSSNKDDLEVKLETSLNAKSSIIISQDAKLLAEELYQKRKMQLDNELDDYHSHKNCQCNKDLVKLAMSKHYC